MLNQTHALLENEVPDDKEPPKCGPVCLITACTGAGGVIFGCLQRDRIRVKHKIKGGNPCGDFCINGCLPCCAIIQQYKEVDLRRKARINNKGYQQNQDMPRH